MLKQVQHPKGLRSRGSRIKFGTWIGGAFSRQALLCGKAQAKACGYKGWGGVSLALWCVLGFLVLMMPRVAWGQVVTDTTVAAVGDTTRLEVQGDSARVAGPPLGFIQIGPGEVVADTLPARLPVLDPTGILGRVPGSFVYAFGTPGWPDAWSPFGLRPEQVEVVFQQLPLNDLITGRPRYDLLPVSALEPVRVGGVAYGSPVSVLAAIRQFGNPRPLTEIRYWGGANSLQSVEVSHAQHRQPTILGQRGVLDLLAFYGGRSSTGEYPGSRLRRERMLMGRVRWATPGWSLELIDLLNRKRVGAHAGVLPPIFRRVGAQVENGSARRQTLRNDLSATLRARLLGSTPAALTAFWASEGLLYANGRNTVASDTASFHVGRVGGRFEQEFGGSHSGVRLAGWLDRWSPEDSTGAPPTRSMVQLHGSVVDTLSVGAARLGLGAGGHYDGWNAYPSLSAGLSRDGGPIGFHLSGRLAGQERSWFDRYGFGAFAQGVEGRPGPVGLVEAGLERRGRVFDAGVTVFGSQTRRALEFYEVDGDTARAFLTGSPVTRIGAALDLGWRREARRGFYARAQPTIVHFLDDNAAPNGVRVSETLPEVFAEGRFGARYLLFKGDLDLNVHLDGRAWSRMRSRTLHPATGLLVMPRSDDPWIGPSGTLDVVVEAGVRTATIFVGYYNVLASSTGGGLYEGTLLVPTYPLPERSLRFGVFWPIQD